MLHLKTKFIFFLALFCLTVFPSKAQDEYLFRDRNATVEERVEDLVNRMSLEEKIDLLAGYQDFYLHPCERLGIPAFKLADGPLGLSSWGLFGKATAFPSALSTAASWNRNLLATVGAMYAQEWRARGIHFLLAPGVNNYRASKGARNFEYYGEDPYLATEMIVPFIKGVQEGGVIATIKHYAVNDQEFDRYRVSSEIDERTMREITFPPFEAAIKRADVKAFMTGYNPVNGVYCTENRFLNVDVLRNEWGFKGMLMSDWACTYSMNAAIHGLDLEMGSKRWFNREKMIPAIESGELSVELINEKIRRIYGPCIEMGFFDREQKLTHIPTYNPAANKAALEGAREGIILLKNDESFLPITDPQTIAVIGPTANHNLVTDRFYNVQGITYGGGGSSKVHPWHVTSLLEGVIAQYPNSTVYYHEGISNRFKTKLFEKGGFVTATGDRGLKASYYKLDENALSEAELSLLREQAKAAGRSDVAIIASSGATLGGSNSLVKEQVERTVNYEWWGAPHGLTELGENYKVVWEGLITPEQAGTIHLFVNTQGGYILYLNGEVAIDASTSSSFHFGEKSIQVKVGEAVDVKLEYTNRRSSPSEIRMGYCYESDIDFSEPVRLASNSDLVIFSAGLDGAIELEGRDRPFDLPFGQDHLINELAKVNENIIVNIIAGGAVNMTKWIDRVKSVLHALYPGQAGGQAIAEIIAGKVNPSAKLPFSIEKRWEDSPAYGNYDETRHERKVYYREGIFTGYRGYDKNQVEPLFPFGFGLSYTQFEYSNLEVEILSPEKREVKVSFDIQNSGKYAGAEIAQVYVRDVVSKEPRPLKELKGFEKVFLQTGETKRVELKLDEESFRYFNSKAKSWVMERGEFEIWVGSSSADIKFKKSIQLK
ncbi:MAG: glycoside hydrolase family 3 protein [Phocaeicola sp.]